MTDVTPRWKAGPRETTSRVRLRPLSPQRRRALRQRTQVREDVRARDRVCQGPARGLPGQCRILSPERPRLEVHERVPRGRDSRSWLDPGLCVLLCQAHHDYCTSAYGTRLAIVRAAGLDVHADPVDTLRLDRGPA